MEVGKWIVLAFLTGVVIVGFKTRSLKGWEFAASGAFVLLLDQLVFKGQISDWLGNLGSTARGAAGNASAGMVAFGSPAAYRRVRRFAARMWQHRPDLPDLAIYAVAIVLMHVWVGAPWLVAAVTFTGLLTAFTAISAATAPQPSTQAPDRTDDGPACPVCADTATTWDPDDHSGDGQTGTRGADMWRCRAGHRFAQGLTARE